MTLLLWWMKKKPLTLAALQLQVTALKDHQATQNSRLNDLERRVGNCELELIRRYPTIERDQ